jgi:hypothetical protein
MKYIYLYALTFISIASPVTIYFENITNNTEKPVSVRIYSQTNKLEFDVVISPRQAYTIHYDMFKNSNPIKFSVQDVDQKDQKPRFTYHVWAASRLTTFISGVPTLVMKTENQKGEQELYSYTMRHWLLGWGDLTEQDALFVSVIIDERGDEKHHVDHICETTIRDWRRKY